MTCKKKILLIGVSAIGIWMFANAVAQAAGILISLSQDPD